ncbi:MAG: metal ABC transporter permease [Eubacteriales bacterium]|nr:metal ABC transporter permease [Eubacteriales bacterium]
MFNIFNSPFMQNALLACIFSSIICGIIGIVITEKKLVMMSGGIAHTAYGGVGLGYFLGFEPMIGAILFSIASAFSIGFIQKKSKLNADMIIGLLWSFGMALGILFFTMTTGYKASLESYLFGNVLSVLRSDIITIACLSLFVLLTFIIFKEDWKSYLFDEQFAWLKGQNTMFFQYFMLILIALSIVALIHVVGIILVIAMLTAPAASAGLLSKRFGMRMVFAVMIGFINCMIGLYISYYLNIATGACIVVVSILTYFILFIIKNSKRKFERKQKIT